MKSVVIVSWILAVLVSFFRVFTDIEHGSVFARILGSVLGMYLYGWILAFLATLFEKKESRRDSRKAALPYTMIAFSLLALLETIFGDH